jgi:ribulose-5-phosphate 4-epimerase/fuculose-1-phosphate aldolase
MRCLLFSRRQHGEGIFNHLTQVVPGKPDRYYQIPFAMHWSEVKASSFMEVGINDGEVKRGTGDVERSCYCIHARRCKFMLCGLVNV